VLNVDNRITFVTTNRMKELKLTPAQYLKAINLGFYDLVKHNSVFEKNSYSLQSLWENRNFINKSKEIIMIISTEQFMTDEYNINVQLAAKEGDFGYLRIKNRLQAI